MKLHIAIFTAVLLLLSGGGILAQTNRTGTPAGDCGASSPLNGLYRIDVASSDKLYSVIEGAASTVPFGEQQQFFIDLAIRLTPPDLLAVECLGNRVSLGSSRARRVEFLADGITRRTRGESGQTINSRIAFERGNLVFNSTGGDDNLNFTFTPLEDGRRLRVTRRISARELIEPVVIQTVYNKIGQFAKWDIFDESQTQTQIAGQSPRRDHSVSEPTARTAKTETNEAADLRESLEQWISATNRLDIEKQMSFYMPRLKAFYLARNASINAVRAEKKRAFAAARAIDIRAAEPEIVFQDSGRTAIMRFRKKYSITSGGKNRSGEVVQELRWQKTSGDWKIFSERDIRVIR